MDTKKPWESKTYWANILIASMFPLIPGWQAYANGHPQIATSAAVVAMAIINVGLRSITHGKISLD
jgi:hypothetical protein